MTPRLPIAALALATLLLAPGAFAQVGVFGTQVAMGDSDYTPVLKKAATQALFYEAERGIAGDVSDNCVYMRVENTAAFPAVGAARVPVVKKDLRVTPCDGKSAGTQYTDADVTERSSTWAFVATSIQYADVNSNGKYDKGDFVYAVADTGAANVADAIGTGVNDPQGNAGSFADGLVASTATGTWTLRLTPTSSAFGSKPAGTFVVPGDADYTAYRTAAKKEAMVVAEREDKGWYLMPGKQSMAIDTTAMAGTVGGLVGAIDKRFLLGGDIPANAIRVGVAGVGSLQPGLQVLNAELPNPNLEGGKSFPITVTITNNGGAAGSGLLVTKLGSQIVDAQMTPWLGAKESKTIVITVTAPTAGGNLDLHVNEFFKVISVAPGTEALSADASALQARIASLEATVQSLQNQVNAPRVASAETEPAKAPSLAPVAVLLVVLVLAFVRRAK